MDSSTPELRRLLSRLRAGVRRAYVTRGSGYLMLLLAIIVIGSFALDFSLDLPLAVRSVLLVGLLAVLAVVAWRVLAEPLRIPISDLDLAQTIEHGNPAMSDRLISALDFETRLQDADEPESRELMTRVVDDARRMAASVRVDDLIDARPARRAMAGGVLGVLALITVAAMSGSHFGLWLQRGVLLQDVDWPRSTTVHVLEFSPDTPYVVTRGDDVRIVAEVEGVVPRELQLHYEELSDGSDGFSSEGSEIVYKDRRTMYPIEGEERRFAMDLRSVASSFRFWITGGDDLDAKPVYEVRAVIPPRIASITAQVTYPEYSGLAPEMRDLPTLAVLETSRVEYTLVANMPLAGARLVPLPNGDKPAPSSFAARDLVVSGTESNTVVVDLRVDQTLRFHVALTAQAGHTNRPDDDIFQLIATADKAPQIQLYYPETRKLRTPEGLLPVKALVTDDFGTQTVVLEVRRNQNPAFSVQIWPSPSGIDPVPDPQQGEPNNSRKIHVYVPIDLLRFPVGGEPSTEGPIQPTDTISMTLRAEDTTGKVKESSEMTIEVISREAQEKRLSEEQSRLRGALVRLHANVTRNRDVIETLMTRMRTRGVDSASLDRGRNAQVDQGRITNELVQFSRGMLRVLDALVLNRLSSAPTLERIQPIYDRFLSQPVTSNEEVFPDALYRAVLTEKRSGRLFDPEVVGAALDIMDLADKAVAELSPAVYSALRDWGADELHDDEHLERAFTNARELDRLLTLLEERMQRWEQLAEIIEILRALENTEIELGMDVPVKTGTKPEDR